MLEAIDQTPDESFDVVRNRWPDDDIFFGAEILLNKVFEKEKIKSRIIGVSQYNYLIIEMPLVIGYRARFSPGSTIVIKLVKDGSVYGFYSEILVSQYDPAAILFTKYPREVESIHCRNSQRFICNIPARLFNDKAHYYCMMTDISNGGCRLTVHRRCGLDDIVENEKATMLLSLYGLGELELNCGITNFCRDNRSHTYGVKFKEDSQYSKLLMYLEMLNGSSK